MGGLHGSIVHRMFCGVIDSISMVSDEGVMAEHVIPRFLIPRCTQDVNAGALQVGKVITGIIGIVMGIKERRLTDSITTR